MRSDDSNKSNLTIIEYNRCHAQIIQWCSQCSSRHRCFTIGNRFQQSSVIRPRIRLHHRARAITNVLKYVSMNARAGKTSDGGWHTCVMFLSITIGDPGSFSTSPNNQMSANLPATNDSQTRVLTIYVCRRNLNQPKTDAACTPRSRANT